MAVLEIEQYRQLNGEDILKVMLKSTQKFPEGRYFYCDASDEELVKQYTWRLHKQRQPYVVASCHGMQQFSVPAYSTDSNGFMTHPITGQRLCPM